MKSFFFLFVLISIAYSAPINVSDNNIGDIENISLRLSAVVSANVQANIAKILAALQSQQVVADGSPLNISADDLKLAENEVKEIKLSPEVVDEVQKLNIKPETLKTIAKAFLPK